MAIKDVKKFALVLNYSTAKFGIAFEHSDTDKTGLYVGSALEAVGLAYLMQNSQHVTFDDETKTIATNFRPTGEAITEWPDLGKPEASVSTGTGGGAGRLEAIIDRAKGEQG